MYSALEGGDSYKMIILQYVRPVEMAKTNTITKPHG